MEFKTYLKELRKKANLTQKELARKSGVSYSYITKLENGYQTNPTYEVLAALGDVLGSPLAAVYDFADITPNEVKNLNIFPVQKKEYPVLGDIACGKPIYAAEKRECYIQAGTEINADFCLRCKGDSMINARIFDGDIVFIKKQSMVDNGDIAAVIIDNEATLKRFYYYKESNKLVLAAENPKYEPIVLMGNELNSVYVMGKAIAFQSSL